MVCKKSDLFITYNQVFCDTTTIKQNFGTVMILKMAKKSTAQILHKQIIEFITKLASEHLSLKQNA